MNETTTTVYGWTWVEGETEDEEGNAWIMVCDLSEPDANGVRYADGEELCVIMCRDYEQVKREHPEWIEEKERHAKMIVDALNGGERFLALWSGGYEAPSMRMFTDAEQAIAQAKEWAQDAEQNHYIQVIAFDATMTPREVYFWVGDDE